MNLATAEISPAFQWNCAGCGQLNYGSPRTDTNLGGLIEKSCLENILLFPEEVVCSSCGKAHAACLPEWA
jgi:hypothetical protein